MEYIKLYQDLTHKAMVNTFHAFKRNYKLILTESDLKCWLYLELRNLIKCQGEPNLSVHTEVTHYTGNKTKNNRKEYFMRDLTLLDSNTLDLSEVIWKKINDQYALSKGFKHKGPAMHFELKLIRQGSEENHTPIIDTGDIGKLGNVNSNNRAYTIIIGSKSSKAKVAEIENKLIKELRVFKNNDLKNNHLLRIYVFDTEEMIGFELEKIDNQNELKSFC